MSNFSIITNNPIACEKYPQVSLMMDAASVRDIFNAVRDRVHLGAKLISHPLSGSIKPNESPYKSVVISSTAGALDLKSLQIIEDAIITLKKLPRKERAYSPRVLDDFRVIDLDILDSAISSLPAGYHM